VDNERNRCAQGGKTMPWHGFSFLLAVELDVISCDCWHFLMTWRLTGHVSFNRTLLLIPPRLGSFILCVLFAPHGPQRANALLLFQCWIHECGCLWQFRLNPGPVAWSVHERETTVRAWCWVKRGLTTQPKRFQSVKISKRNKSDAKKLLGRVSLGFSLGPQ
jgi:hypothetical protein